MTIAQRISNRQRRVATRLAETRLDEIVSVAGIADEYGKADRAGDLEIETHFARLYQLVDSEAEKDAVVAAYRVWARSEQVEDLAVTGSVDESVSLLKRNNDLWLGAFVPDGSDGAA